MKVVEVFLLPGTEDNGFFAYFEKIACQMPAVKQLGKFKACHDKQKSILVNEKDEMWVCHYLTNITTGQNMEYVHYVNMKTGKIAMEFSLVPDTSVYRVAYDNLWVALGIFLCIPADARQIQKLTDAVLQNSGGKFEYDDMYHDIRSYSIGRSATLQEVIMMLSMELRR